MLAIVRRVGKVEQLRASEIPQQDCSRELRGRELGLGEEDEVWEEKGQSHERDRQATLFDMPQDRLECPVFYSDLLKGFHSHQEAERYHLVD